MAFSTSTALRPSGRCRSSVSRVVRSTAGAEDEISLPVSRDGAVLHLGRAFTDHHHVGDSTDARSRLSLSVGASGTQTASQLAAQLSPALDVEGLVDGLVAHAHLAVVGIDQR